MPVGAVRVEGIGVTVSWSAQGWGLADAPPTFSATCQPNLPPPRAMTAPETRTPPTPEGRTRMTITQEQATWFAQTFGQLADNVERAVLGKRHVVELVLTAMLSDGHVLLEDVPGHRQDLARPGDGAVGAGHEHPHPVHPRPAARRHHRHHASTTRRPATFEFHAGPVFANIVLADEINRASPKTQSALLEVMEEGRVTVDGVSRQVGVPFLVLATQNPVEQAGTYRLPEAQLDRFMMRTSLGYPDHAATVRILDGAAVATGELAADHHAAGARRHGRPRRATSTSTRSCSTTSPGSSTPPARPTRCAWASASAAPSRSRAPPAPAPPRRAAPTRPPTTSRRSPCRCSRTA